ncbi:calcium-independent phospholipase A2-gamma isoform X1 [Oryzias melastigma]|uniref:Calcium-independent phospholipase A2-gamma-like n=1 Tax=Oryzias melastigma TaxID=30732 RepID=A0A3B3BV56_ORYME|nr:calcium-independent phospholipase A2-gamma isoform X1 [Oryzias melastigma]
MNHSWAPNVWVKVNRVTHKLPPYAHRAAGSSSIAGVDLQHHAAYSAGYLSFRHFHHSRVRYRRGWICKANHVKPRVGLHTSCVCLNASTSRWSAGLSQHMSRFRSTLDSLSKAVSGTQTDLLSRMSRLKSKGSNEVKALTDGESTPPSTNETPPLKGTTIPTPAGPSSVSVSTSIAPVDVKATTSPHPHTQVTVTAAIVTISDMHEKRPRRTISVVKASCAKKPVAPPQPLNDTENRSTTPKDAPALFHPSTFSVSLDETYTYLAHHINTYFGSSTKTQDQRKNIKDVFPPPPQDLQASNLPKISNKTAPIARPTPPSSKKSLGQYLSSSAPTVQAFVGSYIAPFVPKFRTGEAKSPASGEMKHEAVQVKPIETAVNKEQTVAEEKAKKLLLQREKIIARVSVDNRTRALVQALYRASDVRVYISRVEDLSYHLLEFPDTRSVAVKEKAIPCLLRLMQANDAGLRAAVREALALIGYHKPVRGRGIRVLSIDGGGLRGILALQTLHRLEALTGKPIYKLFDYICGVSTGAVLGFMLGVHQIPVKDCDDIYRKLGSDVFKQNVIVGTMKMSWSHAFYDSEAWENILKEKMGSHLLVETSRNPECPKVAAVSTIVNRGLPLKAYVFRNYNLLPGVRSHYLGGCQHQLWQAIRATSAAPGYFQEFTLGGDLHQDGGLLINNPTALAIHECKCLWPGTPVECVVSLGTGRFETPGKNNATYTSLKTKLTNVISSATDTEEVHAMLDAFLPPNSYFRFNPFLNEDISMDESRQEKLNQLQAEGLRYLERNEEKIRKVAAILTREKTAAQRLTEWARLKADMYHDLPFKS